MPKTNAREGKELVGTKIDCVAEMWNFEGTKFVFREVSHAGIKLVPDQRALERAGIVAGETTSKVVVITKVVNQVPGILFCNFRELTPNDVVRGIVRAGNINFIERIEFNRFEGQQLVLNYRKFLGTGGAWWHEALVEGNSSELKVKLDGEKFYFQRRADHDSGNDGLRFGWWFGFDRSLFDALGKGRQYFEGRFWINDENDQQLMTEHFGKE